jgi:uncharacterized protein YecE (DUF72 family)
MIRVGPAGWAYADWEGRVYPAHRPPGFHPLRHLARYFDGIEIDSSFYAPPRAEHAARWVQLVESHATFRFWMKLHRDFTHGAFAHEPVESESTAWDAHAAVFRDGIEPIVRARRLEALLAQFPVTFLYGKNEIRRLGRLRALFDGLPLVLEVRHESWFSRPALDTVRGLGWSLAHVDMPAAWNHPPDRHAPTGPIGYLRLHGRNSAQWFREGAERDDRYDYLYGAAELDQIARRAERIAAEHDTTAVVTNNHFAGQAVANALELLHILRGEPVPAPAEIVECFPRLRAAVRIEGQQPLF